MTVNFIHAPSHKKRAARNAAARVFHPFSLRPQARQALFPIRADDHEEIGRERVAPVVLGRHTVAICFTISSAASFWLSLVYTTTVVENEELALPVSVV